MRLLWIIELVAQKFQLKEKLIIQKLINNEKILIETLVFQKENGMN